VILKWRAGGWQGEDGADRRSTVGTLGAEPVEEGDREGVQGEEGVVAGSCDAMRMTLIQ